MRVDLPGHPRVSAREFDHGAAPFRTVIKRGPAEVHTVEHILSALAGFGITDCEIEIDGIEVPGMDGSAAPFLAAILDAGINAGSTQRMDVLTVTEPVELTDGGARIQALPNPGSLQIEYTLHYPGHSLAQGTYTFELTEAGYIREIAPARTFAIRKDAEAMRAAGLGKGADMQNTVIIEGDQALETELRFPNEPVRHKILDLIGDLYVLERPVHARIVANCSGHRANRMLAQRLNDLHPRNKNLHP